MDNKQVHVVYSGRVQGVGFRFTVEHIARQINVVGWVKNLPDGKVEVLAQGSDEDLKDLLSEIKAELSSYIKNEDVSWSDVTEEFKNFRIKF
ncbi:MAG: acylphosphatase [Candidatus Omnitrophota bacterium]